jgi:4-hydroxy-2-oxoheptanedioate aldolase
MRLRTGARDLVLAFFILSLISSHSSFAAERANRLISIFESGKAAIGMYIGARAPNMARVVGTSGLDFIIVDMEHDVYDYGEVHQYMMDVQDAPRHGWGRPGTPLPSILVKLAHRGTWDPRHDIAHSFKTGPVVGVFVPFVENRADLEKAISAARNPEMLQLEGISAKDRRERLDVWPLNPKGELLVVAMIESEAGIRNAREIMETPGLGVFHIAHAPEPDTERMLHMCLERGVICGREETDPAKVKQWVDAGYKLIDLGWDYRMYQRELNESLKTIRSSLEKDGN